MYASKPEDGLAEWSSKIRAMQKTIDQDEENEQRKLEEEIAASRLARQRRSQGAGYSDTGRDTELRSRLARIDSETARLDDEARTLVDRQRSQADTVKTLVKKSSIPIISTRPSASTPVTRPLTQPTRKEPVSLAAFMGGNATGPRLNRHAPQQDAHDPTQFEQRARIDHPHPVFGRGGVAMPGMASKPSSVKTAEPINRSSSAATPTTPIRPLNPLKSPTPVERSFAEAPVRSVSPQKTGRRERTISTPAYSPSSNTKHKTSSLNSATTRAAKVPIARSSMGSPDSTTTLFLPKDPARAVTVPSVVAPTLARPVQPHPKKLPLTPELIKSNNPSPAFLRTMQQKEPTPSISRLKGRGFVQSMVQASSHRESISPTPLSPTLPLERSHTPDSKKQSVLDRWQPSTPTLSTKPPVAPKPVIRKRKSFPAAPSSVVSMPEVSAIPSLRKQSSRSSLRTTDSLDEAREALDVPRPGSRATRVLYIPDAEEEAASKAETSSAVSEVGVRTRSPSSRKASSVVSSSSSSTKPLVHPTKDRARKPKKSSSLQGTDEKKQDSITTSPIPPRPSAPPIKEVTKSPPIAGRWADQAVIGVKATPSPSKSEGKEGNKTYFTAQGTKMGLSRPLPGMASNIQRPFPPSALPKPQGTPSSAAAAQPSAGPTKLVRIPSTGNRATVMDVVQSMLEVPEQPTTPAEEPSIPAPPVEVEPPQAPVLPTPNLVPQQQIEKRRSSYEKYSSFTMPPLKEETTPAPTPSNTLKRPAQEAPPTIVAVFKAEEKPKVEITQSIPVPPPSSLPPVPVSTAPAPSVPVLPVEVTLQHNDEPLPPLDMTAIDIPRSLPKPPQASQISVEVLSIIGSNAQPVAQTPHIFYDTEVLAIVNRSKSKSSGLVISSVWGWQGKNSSFGEKEAQKLHDVAKRYNTTLFFVKQSAEPIDLVRSLGGQLVTRQGTRNLWTSDNTTMHIVRSMSDVVFVDEHELSISNLCSGYCYVILVLDVIYIWDGRGSLAVEKEAAATYASSLSGNQRQIFHLFEGMNDTDEMFWMILGDGAFASADYWRWKKDTLYPRVWRIDALSGEDAAYPVPSLGPDSFSPGGTYIADCIFELFVVVGAKARGARDDIRLAISMARALSERATKSRPFVPAVHVLVLPSQLPRELVLHFRDLDEKHLNGNEIPDHMNLIPEADALEQLERTAWKAEELKDTTMLPLGISPAMLNKTT